MAISLSSLKRRDKPKLPIIVLYATHGIGKTTFASGAPNPVILAIEDGLGELETPHWGPDELTDFDSVMDAFAVLGGDDHDFQTVVVDSLDWLEALVWRKTCVDNKWSSLEDAGYGKGYLAADTYWQQYIDCLKYLRDVKNMLVIQLAHAEVKTYNSPDSDPYDRYMPKLHKRANAKLQEHADIVGYIGWRVSVQKTEQGFNKKSTRGVGVGQRVLHFEERPAFLAKNRYNLPQSIDLPKVDMAAKNPQVIWEAFAKHLPQF